MQVNVTLILLSTPQSLSEAPEVQQAKTEISNKNIILLFPS